MSKYTVATITYHRSDNFGSVLQAYALGEKLRKMGYNQYLIDYRKPEVQRMYRILQIPKNKFQAITDCYHLLYYPALKCRQRRFEQFRQAYFRLSTTYISKQELLEQPPTADVYITGSDQVWNTPITDFDESYLLDFVRQGKKVSYAASGISKKSSPESLSLVGTHIQDFHRVSVRENVARQRLTDYCVADVTADPVLLLSRQDWDKLCVPVSRKKPYMLCYFAGGVTEAFERVTRGIADRLGLERVILMPQWRNLMRPGKCCYDAGPAEFLSLIRSATLVCTNSFHGTAFSLLMNVPFLVGQAEPFADDRLNTLLEAVGMQDRQINPAEPVLPENICTLDFAKVNSVLEYLRKRDAEWLRNAIEDSL